MAYSLDVEYYNSILIRQNTSPALRMENTIVTPIYYSYAIQNQPWITSSYNWEIGPRSAGTPLSSTAWNGPGRFYAAEQGSCFTIEESRIYGEFNRPTMSFGVRAFLKEDNNDIKNRSNALVYSGIYNNRTDFNETNVFSIGSDITKSLDPSNGSIQLIDAMDNNLTIYQENKVSQALIDKDAIYSAEGAPLNTTSNVVIGQVTPYVGDYGISKDPFSHAKFGFRRYFTDRFRNCVMRLSRDGLTEISKNGMVDFFRDRFLEINDKCVKYYTNTYEITYNPTSGVVDQNPAYPTPPTKVSVLGGPYIALSMVNENDGCDIEIGSQVEYRLSPSSPWIDSGQHVTGIGIWNSTTNVRRIHLNLGALEINGLTLDPQIRFYNCKKDYITGAYDNYKDNYVLTIANATGSKSNDESSDSYNTTAFDESVLGWTTFYSYRPNGMFSLKGNFYSYKNKGLYLHYSTNVNHNNFYNQDNDSHIIFVFNNNPSIVKNFKTINYEGSSGWKVDYFTSDPLEPYYDITNSVASYQEGFYTENGIPYRAGFNLKENKYYANLISNSTGTSGEVVFNNSVTGIKGFFATVKISTDSSTDFGGVKELFSVGTEIVVSSR